MPPTSTPPTHVVAAVIRDRRGRILLARRTAGRDLAGLWEFPGGKREPHEDSRTALRRELEEELGISHIQVGAPLICVPYAYTHKRIVLEVFGIDDYRGRPRGLEQQALAWSPPERLARYPMPAADRPVVAALTEPSEYLITPEPSSPDDFLQRLQRALRAGVRRFNLRAPYLHADTLRSIAQAARKLAGDAQAQMLIAREVDLAAELGTGVHLSSKQLRELSQRPLPADQLVAASCHDAEELRLAEALGCDFAVLSPIKATPSHPATQPLGWQTFAALREHSALPIYGLGGLAVDDLCDARAAGAQGIAAMRGLWPLIP